MPKVVSDAPDGGALSCATSHGFVSAGWIDRTGSLADFDVRDRLGEIATLVLAITGSADLPTPPAPSDRPRAARHTDPSAPRRLVRTPAPAEAPAALAQLITQHALISNINQSAAFSFLSDIDRDS